MSPNAFQTLTKEKMNEQKPTAQNKPYKHLVTTESVYSPPQVPTVLVYPGQKKKPIAPPPSKPVVWWFFVSSAVVRCHPGVVK